MFNEIVWQTVLFTATNFVSGLYALNFIIAFTILFLERKDPSATLAWIMILFLLPGVGILLYLVLSQSISRKKIFKKTKFEELASSNSLREQWSSMKKGDFVFGLPEAKKWTDMIQLNQAYGEAYYTQDNRLTILTDGRHKFDVLLSDIEKARYSINMMYYIIKNDALGRTVLDALKKKAKEGLEVRLLLDALGSRSINKKMIQELKEAGVRFALFFPPKLKYLTVTLNYRNHRKLVIIDNEIGYIGGFNVGNEYLGKKKKFGYWRDTHLRVTGGCIQDLNSRFILDWRLASGEKLTIPRSFYPEPASGGTAGIQIVSCGPDSPRTEVKLSYIKMIANAKKNIYIQTPYFIPDLSMYESLKMAALSGVDVRIMIPCMPDHIFVYWATYHYVGRLLDYGVKIYIYDNGFLHAKTIVADGEVASIGSANFDIRSFKLNFEANAFIYDSAEAYKLESIFETDIVHCHELTRQLYRSRSLLIRFKESIARLLSDLL